MGSSLEEQGRYQDEHQHEVTLTNDFYLGMTQVTQAQYERVMGTNPSHFQGDNVSNRDSSEFPVEMVSWDNVVDFCRRLSELPLEKKAGRIYRLPTEAEWEYGCRAGSTAKYCFGDSFSQLSDYGWFRDNSGNRPHPVALKRPNAWGIYDTHGNVWEWCSDWYGDYPSGSVVDPSGPSEGSNRVIRGGNWGYEAAVSRSASRYWFGPSLNAYGHGFRVALSLSKTPKKARNDR